MARRRHVSLAPLTFRLTLRCPDAVDYLSSRSLWPDADRLNAASASIARLFRPGCHRVSPCALIAVVRDIDGDLVTAHMTYLRGRRKLKRSSNRANCSRRSQVTKAALCSCSRSCRRYLGVGEGIETCLAAARLHDIPTWAALTTSLLARFEPPATIKRLLIFADRDAPGLEAAARLMERLQGRVALELRTPPARDKDFNDLLSNYGHAS